MNKIKPSDLQVHDPSATTTIGQFCQGICKCAESRCLSELAVGDAIQVNRWPTQLAVITKLGEMVIDPKCPYRDVEFSNYPTQRLPWMTGEMMFAEYPCIPAVIMEYVDLG